MTAARRLLLLVVIASNYQLVFASTLEYAKFRETQGVVLKASEKVVDDALNTAVSIVDSMTASLRTDIKSRLVATQAALAIIPQDEFITALPEFASLSGQLDPNGNPYDSFAIRGAGAVIGQPVSATAEENLLGLPSDPFSAESITHHEFAHGIMNLGFDDADHERWTQIFQNAVTANTFPGTFAMTNRDEYWAELTQSFFAVNNEIGGPLAISINDPPAYAFLEEVYGASPAQKNSATPLPWLMLLLEED